MLRLLSSTMRCNRALTASIFSYSSALHPANCAPFYVCASVFWIPVLAVPAQKAATTSSLSFAGRIAKPLRGGGGAAPVPSGPTPISGGGAAYGSPLARLQNEEGYVVLTLGDGNHALTNPLTLRFFSVLRSSHCPERVSRLLFAAVEGASVLTISLLSRHRQARVVVLPIPMKIERLLDLAVDALRYTSHSLSTVHTFLSCFTCRRILHLFPHCQRIYNRTTSLALDLSNVKIVPSPRWHRQTRCFLGAIFFTLIDLWGQR